MLPTLEILVGVEGESQARQYKQSSIVDNERLLREAGMSRKEIGSVVPRCTLPEVESFPGWLVHPNFEFCSDCPIH